VITLLTLVAKTTMVALLGLAAARALRRTRASIRHLVLACTLAAMALLPIAAMVLPRVGVPVGTPALVYAPPLEPATTTPRTPASVNRQTGTTPKAMAAASSTTLVLTTLVLTAWAFGAVLLSTPFVLGVAQLGRLRRRAIPWIDGQRLVDALARDAALNSRVIVVLDETIDAPLTCGVHHPTVILPTDARNWSDLALRRAVIHELEHVRRRDWWVHLAGRAICTAYWFNPFAWMTYRQLGLEAERACDDAVVATEEGTRYAMQLVALANRLSGSTTQPALAMAARSDLARRVTAVLDAHQVRGRVGARRVALIVSLAAASAAAVAPLHPVAPAPAAAAMSGVDQDRARPARASIARDRALLESADEGDLDGMRELLDAGANINAVILGDGSPLIVAAREGHVSAVTLLLERGADTNLGVAGDGNPLIMAAREGHAPIVELLLNHGARVDQVVPGDENALIQASGEGRLDVVKLLIARGANVNARVWAGGVLGRRNGEWRTPLSMAQRGGHRPVETLLLAAGARE
jgi:bla regulator protein blaR1